MGEIIKIDLELSGQRIDNFLIRYYKRVPKSHVYKLLRKGAVRVNKKRIKPEYRLQEGDVIFLPILLQEESKVVKAKDETLQFIAQAIVYEDDELIIINKPANLASHGGSGIKFGLIELMRQLRPEIKSLELVHRLDRDTSGCIILAKKRSTLRALHELMRKNQINKIYHLLVAGVWEGGTRKITIALKKNQLKSGERIVKTSNQDEGKIATTIFHPLKRYNFASLLEAELKTGRTHQIRVHAASINHPIAGDEKYGDKNFNSLMKKYGLRRLFLHAGELRFLLSNRLVHVKAPLPEELQEVLKKLSHAGQCEVGNTV